MDKLKNPLVYLLLIFLIFLILGYNVYYFVIAPQQALNHKIESIVNKFDEEAIFINQFNYKESIYMVELDDEIIALNEQSRVLKTINKSALSNAQEYGLVNDEFILVTKDNNVERWINNETKEVIMELEK